jgi:hypothetical protein
MLPTVGKQFILNSKKKEMRSLYLDNNQENLLKIFRLLTSYQTIQDELKVKILIGHVLSSLLFIWFQKQQQTN